MEEDQNIAQDHAQNEASASPRATARHPLELVVCGRCQRDFATSQIAFSLTSCSHTICAACLFPDQLGNNINQLQIQPGQKARCPQCKSACELLLLDYQSKELDSLRHCFRPSKDLIDELGMALEFQLSNLIEQRNFFRTKTENQRKVLKSFASDITKARG
ncbi:hypothetical protein T439DRAFT_171346 [Meredithblackwellia eburnea MCA 4105]